jgi:limonene-1,2-epoxide hydrolase
MVTPAPAPMPTPQSLIDAARAPIVAFSDKNWNAVRDSVASDVIYDEVATHQLTEGVNHVIAFWKGWALAFPDSRATFNNAVVSGNTVILEVTWRGSHTGPLQLGERRLEATNRRIEVRACQVCELVAGKPRVIRQYFDLQTMLQQIGAAR